MATKFQWTGKKIAGLVILVALLAGAIFAGEDGIKWVGTAVSTFINLGGMDALEAAQ